MEGVWRGAVQIEGEGVEESMRDELWDRGQSCVGDGTDMLHLPAVVGHLQRCVHTYGLS